MSTPNETSSLVRSAQLTQEMCRRREAMKKVFGDEYEKTVRPAKELLRTIMKRDKIGMAII